MSGPQPDPKDPVDLGIAGAEAKAKAEALQRELANLETWQLILNSSGRPLIVATPQDMSVTEILDVVSWATVQLAAVMHERRKLAQAKAIEVFQSIPEGVKPS